MKKKIKHLVIMLIINMILTTIFYSVSSFKIGNRADIIEFMGIAFFFFLLFLISVISYIILHYIFHLNGKQIFIITNILIIILILFNHCENWRNPYLLICTPVYLIMQFFLVVLNRKNNKVETC